jgi:hypothetical protein
LAVAVEEEVEEGVAAATVAVLATFLLMAAAARETTTWVIEEEEGGGGNRTPGRTVTYDGWALILDGARRMLFSGDMHYPRSTPEVVSTRLSLWLHACLSPPACQFVLLMLAAHSFVQGKYFQFIHSLDKLYVQFIVAALLACSTMVKHFLKHVSDG